LDSPRIAPPVAGWNQITAWLGEVDTVARWRCALVPSDVPSTRKTCRIPRAPASRILTNSVQRYCFRTKSSPTPTLPAQAHRNAEAKVPDQEKYSANRCSFNSETLAIDFPAKIQPTHRGRLKPISQHNRIVLATDVHARIFDLLRYVLQGFNPICQSARQITIRYPPANTTATYTIAASELSPRCR